MIPGEIHIDALSKRYQHRVGGSRRSVSALNEVSLDVAPGEMLGLIGSNGAGKSTLLNIVAGITEPTDGCAVAEGRVAGILTLGHGFHPLFTGRENAYTAGLLSGMSRRETRSRLDEIIAFSELGPAADDPMRTYSTGMVVRLAYAVAAHVEADILLVDEALAVGDLAFATRCLAHMETVRAGGTTIVWASHDLATVRERCDRAAWLARGELVEVGAADTVVARYESATHTNTLRSTPEERLLAGRIGAAEVEIAAVTLTTDDGSGADSIGAGRGLDVVLDLVANQRVDGLVVGVSIHDEAGERRIDLHRDLGESLDAGDRRSVRLALRRVDLAGGRYHVAAGAYAPDFERAYDYLWHAHWFTVVGMDSAGPIVPPHSWTVDDTPT